jgi:hypothetical protein
MKSFLCLAFIGLTAPARADDRVQPNDLKQIGLAFHNFVDTKNRGPKDADELAPFFENSKKLLDHLKTKRIDFVFGVSLKDLEGTGVSNTIIAHEKDAATRGGLVLFGDTSVRKLSAEEFAKTAKAKKD